MINLRFSTNVIGVIRIHFECVLYVRTHLLQWMNDFFCYFASIFHFVLLSMIEKNWMTQHQGTHVFEQGDAVERFSTIFPRPMATIHRYVILWLWNHRTKSWHTVFNWDIWKILTILYLIFVKLMFIFHSLLQIHVCVTLFCHIVSICLFKWANIKTTRILTASNARACELALQANRNTKF